MEHRRCRNSDIAITGTQTRLDGADDVATAVKDCDAFLLCADHPGRPGEEIEQWANTAAYARGVPWLTTEYSGPKYGWRASFPARGAPVEIGVYVRAAEDRPHLRRLLRRGQLAGDAGPAPR